MQPGILLVDDESVTRRVVTYALKAIDVAVIAFENGGSTLEQAPDLSVELAIIDINLPDMDGFEVIRRLKQLPNMQHVPMIVFTARSHPGDKHAALDAGAVDFLYKPFSTQELRELVNRHLGRSL